MKHLSVILCLLIIGISVSAKKVKGYVYLDSNNNEQFDSSEKGMEGILVSNGIDIVTSDNKGMYEIEVPLDAPLFVIKPSGYISKQSAYHINENYTFNKPQGSPAYKYAGIPPTTLNSIHNFALYTHPESAKTKIGFIGDTQTRNRDEIYFMGKVVGEQIIDEKYDFVVPIGDLCYDDLNILDDIRATLGVLDCPVFPVFGNHDRNVDAPTQELQDETFKSYFGPSYYAFNYGTTAFIVLNDVFHTGTQKYLNKLDDRQLQFVQNLLKHIPSDQQIFIFTHIPISILENKAELLSLFVNHPKVKSASGHTHTQYFHNTKNNEDGWKHTAPMTELVGGALCGGWWSGERDMYGIPQSTESDGTPKGYWSIVVDNDDVQYDYKVSGNVPNQQMHIWTPFPFAKEKTLALEQSIIATIFAGNENTKVRYKIDNMDWEDMDTTTRVDPYFSRLMELQKDKMLPSSIGSKLPGATQSPYKIWSIGIPQNLTNGVHVVTVHAQNNMGLNSTHRTLLYVYPKEIEIQGHRGCRGLFPENSIEGFKHAIDCGAQVLELDIVVSKDKQLVISHEPYMHHAYMLKPNGDTISEQEERSLNTYTMNYNTIAQYDGGSKFFSAFPEQVKIKTYKPLLSAMIDSMENYTKQNKLPSIRYNIEIKSNPKEYDVYQPQPEEIVNLLLAVVKEKKIANRVIVQSFDPTPLNILHKQQPNIDIAFLTSQPSINANLSLLDFKPRVYSPHFSLVNAEMIDTLHRKNIKVVTWTVNDLADIKRIKTLNIDGIITDYPYRLQ